MLQRAQDARQRQETLASALSASLPPEKSRVLMTHRLQLSVGGSRRRNADDVTSTAHPSSGAAGFLFHSSALSARSRIQHTLVRTCMNRNIHSLSLRTKQVPGQVTPEAASSDICGLLETIDEDDRGRINRHLLNKRSF